MTTRILNFLISEVEDLSPDVFRVRLQGRAEAFFHHPGQYLELQLDDETWRPFSIANAYGNDGMIELHIQHRPESESSVRVREMLRGAHRVTLRLPGGDCVLAFDSVRPLLLVAAGTGFAQMKAIAEAALRDNPDREIDLWWSARERCDLYLERLPREWARAHPGFRFHAVTEALPEISWAGKRVTNHRGRIDQVLAAGVDDVSACDVYLSGSPGMVYACVDVLAFLGLEPSRAFSDVFAYAPRDSVVSTAGSLVRERLA